MKKKRKSISSKIEAKSNRLCWYFPSTDHGENDGFSDSLLEYFQGDHEKFIAREAIQNAVDARADYNKPVTVIFEHTIVPVEVLPDHKTLLDRLSRCLIFVKNQDKAEKFFKSAITSIKSGKLSVLKISDFNTKGLSGLDDDVGGNWYRLVRATGTSSPKGVAGGSFGIGKGAPIAASEFRCVFYSSINEKGQPVFQGKARLVSHHDDEKDVRQGVGFFGVEGYNAIREENLIPDFFKRKDQGTDIYIMGYKSENGWQNKLIKSVLHNFWLAISCGDLEIKIKDGTEKVITKDNLKECLDELEAEEAKFYFESVTNWTQKFEEELKHLGKVTLFVRKHESYPGKIMMVRKPKMLVQEKGYRVLREPYAGVFVCENDKGNELLRDLEPPAHDKWDKDRANNGLAALRELDEFIKKKLKSMGEAITSEPQDIPGLDRYLPDSEDKDYMPKQDLESSDPTELLGEEETGREIGATKEPTTAEIESVIRKGLVTNKQQGLIKATPHEGDGGVQKVERLAKLKETRPV